ncbi:urease accessory protein UreF [Oceanobacillus alkalisoli]|uniref:urease accessory protein UreF n=1 Tax=Oceanobacillus alkalisoli TaxID=2925113 RepID=UPI001EF11EFA|nr:urease accessory protein UreF [Oceanobacillus alkalisoli]MCF3944321.1 urease accessory protein UreF [Oceanobacillus alkalisoli]MCG5104884.1 urease accessory protein UreF [Oceanobacillus alkalisoli]
MTSQALSLLQLCDSNFPNGAFSQSFGLETYIQKDIVKDAATFTDWLNVYLHEQLTFADGLAARMAYEALNDDELNRLWELDRILTVQNLARESRDGTQRMGDRMLDIAESIYQIPLLATYKEKIKNKQAFGHSALAFTIVGHDLNVEKETTILYYLYSTVVSLVQNAVRAIPLGQTTGQKIIYAFQAELKQATEKIMQLEESEFGIVSPGLELSQMQHERVGIRIFSS